MVQLFLYLVSVGLVVVGALGFIAALSIPGRIRAFLACLAACIPMAAGVWIFRSAGLSLKDLTHLTQTAAKEAQEWAQGMRDAKSVRQELEKLGR